MEFLVHSRAQINACVRFNFLHTHRPGLSKSNSNMCSCHSASNCHQNCTLSDRPARQSTFASSRSSVGELERQERKEQRGPNGFPVSFRDAAFFIPRFVQILARPDSSAGKTRGLQMLQKKWTPSQEDEAVLYVVKCPS